MVRAHQDPFLGDKHDGGQILVTSPHVPLRSTRGCDLLIAAAIILGIPSLDLIPVNVESGELHHNLLIRNAMNAAKDRGSDQKILAPRESVGQRPSLERGVKDEIETAPRQRRNCPHAGTNTPSR